jgi:DNA-binding transcriptional regulator GbsR (MarR family)
MLNFRDFILSEEYQFQDVEIANMYMQNPPLKIKEISEKTGKSIAEIYRSLNRSGMKANRMTTNHEAVISLRDAKMTVRQIAELTGYTERNVRYILEKKESH